MSTGIIGLIILAIVVVLFVTNRVPGMAVCLIGCMLLFFFCNQPFRVVFGGFSHSVTILIAASMAIGVAMFDTGAAQVIARAVIRLSRDNELVFIIGGAFVSGVLSMFLANTAVVACFLPIIESVARASKNMNRMNMTFGITFGAMYGGACTLVGSTPQVTAAGILNELAGPGVPEIGMWGYMPVGIILFAWYLIYVAFIGYPLGKKIWGVRQATELDLKGDAAEFKDVLTHKYDNKKIAMMLGVFCLMVLGYLWGKYTPAAIAVTAVILCILFKLTTVSSIVKNLDWNVAIMLGALLGFAAGFDGSGAGALIANGVMHTLGDAAHPMMLLVVISLITLDSVVKL